MPSRSNKATRSMAAQANVKPKPRMYGTPTGAPIPSAASAAGRPRVGSGTRTQMRAAIDADQAAATAGAKQFAVKRRLRQTQQQPATGLQFPNPVSTIKKKQAGDKKTIDDMSQ